MLIRRAMLMMGLILVSTSIAAAAQVEGFAHAMHASMERMHAGMMVAPSGDADRDFAAMMIPHHQGAVDMAMVELRFGKDERLRRLAQGIIVEQQQEIAVMRDILAGQQATPKHQ